MGNTILAHTLFACNKVDLDLSNFFNKNGNAHAINKFNKSNLYAKHLIEFPNSEYYCVLTVVCEGWFEVLRIKFSYGKWTEEVPTINNYSNFFNAEYSNDVDKQWNDFYQVYRDPQWPDCEKFSEISKLPTPIQEEILSVYQESASQIETEQDFVAWLTICYYDLFTLDAIDHFPGVKKLDLGQYINGDATLLQQLSTEILGWTWDSTRSEQFYQKMLETNKPYILWLEKIKAAVHMLINNDTIDDNFDCWEQALIIAKVCELNDFNPHNIKWINDSCEESKKSIYLEKFRRTLYGKTI